MYIDIAKSNQ